MIVRDVSHAEGKRKEDARSETLCIKPLVKTARKMIRKSGTLESLQGACKREERNTGQTRGIWRRRRTAAIWGTMRGRSMEEEKSDSAWR